MRELRKIGRRGGLDRILGGAPILPASGGLLKTKSSPGGNTAYRKNLRGDGALTWRRCPEDGRRAPSPNKLWVGSQGGGAQSLGYRSACETLRSEVGLSAQSE